MSEKRFSYNIIRGSRQVIIIDCHTCKSATIDVYDDDFKYFVDKLNEQQATINQLNLAIDDLLSHTSCDEIKKENEQLRNIIKQKEEEEKLYAKEILRLNELNKQTSEFTDILGGY